MKLHGYKWNTRNEELQILILNEIDIENESDEVGHVGYNMLILPNKYKDIHSNYLDTIRMLVEVRNGEIIYV